MNTLRGLLLTTILSFGAFTFAAESTGNFLLEAGFAGATVNPSDLNTARADFSWNGTTPPTSKFHSLSGWGVALGYRAFGSAALLVGYEQAGQKLSALDVTGASYSVTESFQYNPVYVMLDVPF